MSAHEISQALARAIDGRRLLSHPFYVRWEKGELAKQELTAYAEQYRAIEANLTETLGDIVDQLPAGLARDLVEENLTDERQNPAPHLELFADFAAACDAAEDAPTLSGARGVVEAYTTSAKAGAVVGLATLAAYELQGAEIAISKSQGLREHYGMDAKAGAFWDVHGELEADHAQWSVDALVALKADPAVVYEAARASACAWWSFLDEREAAAACA